MSDLDARHALLIATDRALGAEASADVARAEAQRLQARLAQLESSITSLTRERDGLRKQVAAIYASTTWRAGHTLISPAARAARALRRAGRRS